MTGPIVPNILWPGSGSSPVGKTAEGLFDDDDEFIEDAPRLAKWVCSSLGYPVMAVELTDDMIYKQFEQSIKEFSTIVNEFNMREQMMTLQGASTASSFTGKLIKSNPLPYIVEVSQMYGTEAGIGGLVGFHKGYITLQSGVQEYNLNTLWSAVSESGNHIEVRRIWHERTPAMTRFFDPFAGGAGQGIGFQNLMGEFGWGSYSVASQYLLMPLYETMLRVQAIELNDTIRRSQFGFDLVNNKLRIFPLPDASDDGLKLWFEYIVTKDKYNALIGAPGTVQTSAGVSTGGVVTDYANAPYDTMQYQYINDVGKRWIWKYCLAQCKLVLGRVLSKYENVPIPNSEIRLDGLTLRQEGQREIEQLILYLRETLIETGRKAQMQKMTESEQNITEVLKRVPMYIYIG